MLQREVVKTKRRKRTNNASSSRRWVMLEMMETTWMSDYGTKMTILRMCVFIV
jgi:hypothetical protein